MNHIMLDIETLGTNNNSLVVSISAVQFDMSSNEIGDKFEIGLNKEQQLEKGAVIDQSTVDWWEKQSDEAKNMLDRLEKVDVDIALNEFNNWIKRNHKAPSKIKLWGNGATFDNVIVRNLFARHGIDFVVPYYADKDVRTLAYVAKVNTFACKFEGVKHNGIDDCLHQIKYCQAGYQKIHNIEL